MRSTGVYNAGRKAGRRTARDRRRGSSRCKIGKEILAGVGGRELRHRRVIESAANNGATGWYRCAVPVIKIGLTERWITGRTFGGRPAVVRTGNAVVDFLPGRLANIVDEEASCLAETQR